MTNKSPGVLDWILLITKRDLLISSKRSASYITPVAFFLIIVSLFPLAFGPEQKQLSSMASNIIWIAALLSSLLAIEGIFNNDYIQFIIKEHNFGKRNHKSFLWKIFVFQTWYDNNYIKV